MPFHHVAITTRDLEATHAFYTEAMGFELVHVDVAGNPEAGPDSDGWARHAFYDTGGGQCLAVWDLHDPEHIPADFETSISRGLGLPTWTNHLAFDAPDLDALDAAKDRWLANGHPVVKVDHGWCTSIYAEDPNGITVEFCCTTAPFDAAGIARAQELLHGAAPPVDRTPPEVLFFEPEAAPVS